MTAGSRESFPAGRGVWEPWERALCSLPPNGDQLRAMVGLLSQPWLHSAHIRWLPTSGRLVLIYCVRSCARKGQNNIICFSRKRLKCTFVNNNKHRAPRKAAVLCPCKTQTLHARMGFCNPRAPPAQPVQAPSPTEQEAVAKGDVFFPRHGPRCGPCCLPLSGSLLPPTPARSAPHRTGRDSLFSRPGKQGSTVGPPPHETSASHRLLAAISLLGCRGGPAGSPWPGGRSRPLALAAARPTGTKPARLARVSLPALPWVCLPRFFWY